MKAGNKAVANIENKKYSENIWISTRINSIEFNEGKCECQTQLVSNYVYYTYAMWHGVRFVGGKVRVSILSDDRKTTVKYNVELMLSLFVDAMRCGVVVVFFSSCLRYLFMVAEQKHVKLPAMNKIRK